MIKQRRKQGANPQRRARRRIKPVSSRANRNNNANEPRYDVCLSFADEDRAYVERVAGALRSEMLNVFYDRYETASLWGKDLYVHLDEIYRQRARFCIMFVSKYYRKKLWTNHERRSAQTRAFLENGEYILPVRLDDTPIPGLQPTVGFIPAAVHSPAEIAKMVAEKISASKQSVRFARNAKMDFMRVLYEGFDYHGMTPSSIAKAIGSRWLIGRSREWTGRIVAGRYELENRENLISTLHNCLCFSWQPQEYVDLSDGKVSVRVRLKPPLSEHSAGGLLFRLDQQAKSYFAFYRCLGKGFSLCRVVGRKLRRIWTGQLNNISDDEFVQLTIIGHGDRLELFVNDSIVATLDVGSIRGRDVALSAMGTGLFEFDDFALYIRNSSRPHPQREDTAA